MHSPWHFLAEILLNRWVWFIILGLVWISIEKKRDNIYFHHYILIFGVDNINEVVNIYTSNKVIKWIASLDFIFFMSVLEQHSHKVDCFPWLHFLGLFWSKTVIKWIASLDFIFLGLFWSKTVKKWIVSLDFFFLGLFWVNIEKKVHELYFSCYILILVGNINEFTSIPKATTGAWSGLFPLIFKMPYIWYSDFWWQGFDNSY